MIVALVVIVAIASGAVGFCLGVAAANWTAQAGRWDRP